jgi:hypothetical protein
MKHLLNAVGVMIVVVAVAVVMAVIKTGGWMLLPNIVPAVVEPAPRITVEAGRVGNDGYITGRTANVTFTLINNDDRAFSTIFVDCALLDADGVPLLVLTGVVGNVQAHSRTFGSAMSADSLPPGWKTAACHPMTYP